MGGIRVNKHMHSNIPGLLAAGEAVGGAGGAKESEKLDAFLRDAAAAADRGEQSAPVHA